MFKFLYMSKYVKQTKKCGQIQESTTIGNSHDFHIFKKDHFQENPIFFRIIADLEAVNGIDNSNIGTKTTNIYTQNPVLNGHYKISELENVSNGVHYQSTLGYKNVDWFVEEVIKIETKMAFYFKTTMKGYYDRGT